MDNYVKRFDEWAVVQKEIEHREYPAEYKVGGVFWINQGVNIGSEQDGKGERFTRPVLIIKGLNERLALVVPISSRSRKHQYRFKLMVCGEIRVALLDQLKVIDVKRVERFVDEIPDNTLRQIRLALANLICK